MELFNYVRKDRQGGAHGLFGNKTPGETAATFVPTTEG
jgi:hypothetical protein